MAYCNCCLRYYRFRYENDHGETSRGSGGRLEKRAKRLGVSKSRVLRDSLERELAALNGAVEEEPSVYDLVKEDLGCVDSGLGDLSTNPKHLEGFGR